MNLTITPSIAPNITPQNNKNNFKFNLFAMKPAQRQNLPANSNLAPLARDTVSFGGLRSDKIISGNPFAELINRYSKLDMKMATDVEREAEFAHDTLSLVLKRYLGSLISSDKEDKPIQRVHCRIKKPKEIFKKGTMVSIDKGRPIVSKQDLKDIVEDIVGARITLRDSSKGAVKKVLQALGQAVEDGYLKVTQIESYRPIVDSIPLDILKGYKRDLGIDLTMSQLKKIQKRDFFDYAAPKDLDAFAATCRSRCRDLDYSGGSQVRANGYQAIHLRVELPDGYKGEIQIMGRDVEALKEYEDVYYKAICGKIDPEKYPEAAKRLRLLAPLTEKEKADPILALAWQRRQDLMEQYTFWAYNGARLQGEKPFRDKTGERFLVAPSELLNEGLGFNQMAPVIDKDLKAFKLREAQKKDKTKSRK